jgi:diguanylate cyclase (GGDEF)-like protein/PAS domain S-box-containing protein
MKLYLISSFEYTSVISYMNRAGLEDTEICLDNNINEETMNLIKCHIRLAFPVLNIIDVSEDNFRNFLPYSQISSEEKILFIGGITFLQALADYLMDEGNNIEITADMVAVLEKKHSDRWKLGELFNLNLINVTSENGRTEDINSYYNAIFDSSEDFIYVKDIHYRYCYVNDNFTKLTGFKNRSDLFQKTDYELFPDEFADKYREIDQEVVEKGVSITDQIERYQKSDGSEGWAKTCKYPVRDRAGKIQGLCGFSIDVTSLINVEKEIEKQKKEFEAIIQTTNDGIIIIDLDTRILFFNKAFLVKSGYSEEELLNTPLYNLEDSQAFEESKRIIREVAEKGHVENVKKTMPRKNGEILFLNLSLAMLPDKKRIIISARNISDTVRKEKQLKEYIKIIDKNVITSTSDIDGRIVNVSDAFCRACGYSREELIGKNHSMLEHEDMPDSINNEIKSAIFSNRVWMGEIKNRRKDGTIYWVNTIVSPMFDNQGERTGYTVVSEDITNEKLVEEKTKEQDSLLSLFEHGDSVLFRWKYDEEYTTDYVSSNVANLLGYDKELFLNGQLKFGDCIHEEDYEKVKNDLLENMASENDYYKNKSYRVLTREGDLKWVMGTTVLQKDVENKISHILGSIIDVTEGEYILKNLEKFIDCQDNIVVLSDGNEITFANRKFLEFLDYGTIELFKEEHQCICELFIENDRFFHLGKIEDKYQWIEEIQKLPYSERMVLLKGKSLKEHVFSVNINKFDENLFILSFSDITQTMSRHFLLEEKSYRDHLTNAYNREFFMLNYESFIELFSNQGRDTGIAILDIDYFKMINDDYGHITGDKVLIQFVSTIQSHIREEDTLVRWGGDEFILLLGINSLESLKAVLEKIRMEIVQQMFPFYENITTSIGGTLYGIDEEIEKTIKRADDNLYIAKKEGRNRVVVK